MSAWPDNDACRGMARVVPIVVAKPHSQTTVIIIKSRRMKSTSFEIFGDHRPRSQPIPMFEAVSTLLYIFGRLHSQHETPNISAVGTLRRCAGGQTVQSSNQLRKPRMARRALAYSWALSS